MRWLSGGAEKVNCRAVPIRNRDAIRLEEGKSSCCCVMVGWSKFALCPGTFRPMVMGGLVLMDDGQRCSGGGQAGRQAGGRWNRASGGVTGRCAVPVACASCSDDSPLAGLAQCQPCRCGGAAPIRYIIGTSSAHTATDITSSYLLTSHQPPQAWTQAFE